MRSIIILAALFFCIAPTAATATSIPFYIGTYTWGESNSKGIYKSRLDLKTGKLSAPILAAQVSNPSYLAIHPNGKVIYAISEAGAKEDISAFAVSPGSLMLEPINRLSSGGTSPCYITVDYEGKIVFVTNYSSGSVTTISIGGDGKLLKHMGHLKHNGSSEHPQRQRAPHPHSITLSPDNRYAFVADLGIDKIMIYQVSQTEGTLIENHPPHAILNPGSGPRHFCFHPKKAQAYGINELSNTVSVFEFDCITGKLQEIQTISTLPAGYEGPNKAAHIVAHPSGKFLYGSNRGHNSIVAYRIDPAKGTLTLIEHETYTIHTPRNFAIDPTGTYCLVANRSTNRVSVFRIHPDSGALDFTGSEIDVPQPVCIQFLDAEIPGRTESS